MDKTRRFILSHFLSPLTIDNSIGNLLKDAVLNYWVLNI